MTPERFQHVQELYISALDANWELTDPDV